MGACADVWLLRIETSSRRRVWCRICIEGLRSDCFAKPEHRKRH